MDIDDHGEAGVNFFDRTRTGRPRCDRPARYLGSTPNEHSENALRTRPMYMGHRDALAMFGNLPAEVREDSFDDIIEAMKKHMRVDAAAPRNGARVIVLAPLRDDAAYAQNKIEINQAVDLAKKSAALISRNITSMTPSIENGSEPSGPAVRPKRRSFKACSTETISEYLEAMMGYIKSEARHLALIENSMRSARAERVLRGKEREAQT
ncbi:unnamed protein product [Haemonchus placei]|uniref:Retrotransposon protein n=1 Tax=Haemonchus placei TaxID=6290 RepID=A0A0N4WNM0_HAEPC|nr:unnamed protein product [Haemonchus placei]